MIDQISDLSPQLAVVRAGVDAALARVLARGWFVLGPEVEAFEQEFAAYCGVAHGVAVGNGTDALELALRGAGVQAGDEVITAANAGAYASMAILAVGARPVYADIDPVSLNLSPQAAAAAITPRTRAIVVTHLYGRMADMPAFRALADRQGLRLLEDCAQAHGACLAGRRAGAWGDAAAFSFYPTKNLGALGDAGAVLCHDPAIAGAVRALRQYGWESKYCVSRPGGRNSRMDELQAAVLRVKLPYLDAWNAARRNIASLYAAHLQVPGLVHPDTQGEDYVAHLYVVRVNRRDTFEAKLEAARVAHAVHYPVLDYRQPAMASQYAGLCLEHSERAVREILTLPCYPGLAEETVLAVCRQLSGQ